MSAVTLTDAEREALTCDCGVMEDEPEWPELFCPFHAGRPHLEVAGSAEDLVAIVERIVAARVRAAKVEALREMAGKIDQGPTFPGAGA